jgi:hypothetical protein
MAELMTSITLGFVAQRALAGSADVTAHVAALEALTQRSTADGVAHEPRTRTTEAASESP